VAKIIKYGDTTGIESDFKQAPVGLYIAKVDSIEEKPSKSGEPMVEIIWAVTKDSNGKKLKEQYSRIWSYAPLDPEASWARRLKDLITAFGLKAKGGNLATIEGKEALIRLREDTDLDGEYRPQVGKVMALKATKAEPEPDEDEDEDEDEASSDGALDEYTRAELKQLIKDEGLEVRVLKSMSDDDLRAAILEVWEPEDEEAEDEEDEDEGDEDEGDEEEGDEEEDEEEDDEDNYDELSLAELRQELKDRELETKGKKTLLIQRLRADDQEEPV
jgi:SAP domain